MKSYREILEIWSIKSTGYGWESLCNVMDAENIKKVATIAAQKYSDQMMAEYLKSLRGVFDKKILSESKIKHPK